MRTDKRAVGIIIKDNKILVFRRLKDELGYYAFPGGGVEEGETPEATVVREMKEELCLDIKIVKLLFIISIEKENNTLFQIEAGKDRKGYSKDQYFYLITEFIGTPELGGPEKERANENNQYHIEWIPLEKIHEINDLYPKEGKDKLVELINQNEL
jgi:8-oxo-dGTP diphosphatase